MGTRYQKGDVVKIESSNRLDNEEYGEVVRVMAKDSDSPVYFVSRTDNSGVSDYKASELGLFKIGDFKVIEPNYTTGANGAEWHRVETDSESRIRYHWMSEKAAEEVFVRNTGDMYEIASRFASDSQRQINGKAKNLELAEEAAMDMIHGGEWWERKGVSLIDSDEDLDNTGIDEGF